MPCPSAAYGPRCGAGGGQLYRSTSGQVLVSAEAAPTAPLAATISPVEVSVGQKLAQVLFSGLTPGFTGLYQVNAILAADTPTGNAVDLNISANGRPSNVVTIAVR